MTLSPDEVAHVARLARLGLEPEEQERLGAQLGAIIDHVSTLQAIDVSDVPETAQVGTRVNVWREDEPAPSLRVEEALAAAPEREGDHLSVGAIQE